MTSETASEPRLVAGWVLRRYALLVVVVVGLSAAAAIALVLRERSSATYTASALVVAAELEIRSEELPRLGQSIFASGAVPRRVAEARGGLDFRTLVPTRISMDPVPESVAFLVRGHAADPVEAASLANLAAQAFVQQLNKAGPGVGTFVLQDAAYPPLEPEEPPLPGPVAVGVAVLGGLLVAAGLVSALIGMRRPVLRPAAAAELVGAPLLGIVTMSGRRRHRYAQVQGVHLLARRLAAETTADVLVVGPGGSLDARFELVERLDSEFGRERLLAVDLDERSLASTFPLPAGGPAVVVVVVEGTASSAVTELLVGYPRRCIAGVVYLRLRRLPRRQHRRAPAAAAPVASPAGTGRGDHGADVAQVAHVADVTGTARS